MLDFEKNFHKDFEKINRGSFEMGSTAGLPLELPVRKVTIPKDFYILKTPVTQLLWTEVMGDNPSEFSHNLYCPVDSVSWDDASEFCDKISLRLERSVRLPSEAEWEYSCRAGESGEYFFGDNFSRLPDYCWFDLNSNDRTHPVALKAPNAWGLYDMVGNIWEWCSDVWFSDYANAPVDGTSRNIASVAQSRRVLRGGAWDMDAFRCRSAYRSYESRELASSKFGLRVVMDLS